MQLVRRLLPLIIATGVTIPLAALCLAHPDVNDFRSFYRGGAALVAGRLPALYHEQYISREPVDLPFVRPPVYALLTAPFSLLPFVPAFWLWTSLELAIFLALLYKAQTIDGRAALACLYPPVLLGVCHGQDCMLPLCALIAAWMLMRKGRHLPGGMALGLGLLKFHLFLLWPVILLIQKRWRALAGFCMTGAVMLAVSLSLAGSAGMVDYLSVLANPKVTSIPEIEVGIGGIMASFGILSAPVQVTLGALLAATVIWLLRNSELEWLFIVIPATALAVTPHALYYDPTMLLLPMWLILRLNDKPLQLFGSPPILSLIFFAPLLPEPWTMVSGVGTLIFLFLAIWRASHARIYLKKAQECNC